jgi:hypothetical protein
MDDEKSLQYQWVYGFLVVVGLEGLPRLIKRRRIRRVVNVSEPWLENRASIVANAAQTGIKLSGRPPGFRRCMSRSLSLRSTLSEI